MALSRPMLFPNSIKSDMISSTLLTPQSFSQAQLHGNVFTAETGERAHIQTVKKMAEEHPSFTVRENFMVYLNTLWCCLHQTLGCELLKILCHLTLCLVKYSQHFCSFLSPTKNISPSHRSVVENKPQVRRKDQAIYTLGVATVSLLMDAVRAVSTAVIWTRIAVLTGDRGNPLYSFPSLAPLGTDTPSSYAAGSQRANARFEEPTWGRFLEHHMEESKHTVVSEMNRLVETHVLQPFNPPLIELIARKHWEINNTNIITVEKYELFLFFF